MSRIVYLEKNQEQMIETKVNEQTQKVTKVFEDKVLSLTNQVAHLKSVLNNDSTNAGISLLILLLQKTSTPLIQELRREKTKVDSSSIQNINYKDLMIKK